MAKINDLTGRVFGRLTVIAMAGRTKRGNVTWKCRCECDGEVVVAGTGLLSGGHKSCGCFRREFSRTQRQKHVIVPGLVFGRLTTISLAADGLAHERKWRCSCSCGSECTVPEHSVIQRQTRSCGCLHREFIIALGHKNATNRLSGTPVGNSWMNMMKRCYSGDPRFQRSYADRGIAVCEYLRGGALNLLALLGQRPMELTLERIDNDGGYWCGACNDCVASHHPLNVKWATRLEQSANRRPPSEWKQREKMSA